MTGWGNVRMSAPRLWENDRDGQKPSCPWCLDGVHQLCLDLFDAGLGHGPMCCGCANDCHEGTT